METQIFYWTGAVAWWCVMGCASLAMVLMAVWLPCYLMIRTRRGFWHWLYAAKIAKYGFTQRELSLIYAYSAEDLGLPEGVEPKHLVNWAGKIKEKAAKEKARTERRRNR